MRSRVFLLFCVLCVSVPCVFGYNWSDNPGDGSQTNPYQISTREQLIAINDLDTVGFYFVLTNDIDLSSQAYTGAVIVSFSGVFDGNSFKILDLTGSSLFGKIEGVDAVVKNLGIENIFISFTNGGGGLAGSLSYGLIQNCYTTGTIEGKSYVGGLVGQSYNNATITDCQNQCNVSGIGDNNWYIGGLVGRQGAGQIIRCYNEGTVTGKHEIGGVVGEQDGEILQSYNMGNVIGVGSGYGIGGIAGFQMSGSIKDCYNTGSIEGSSLVGGITGRGGIIRNCYTIGQVSGNEQIGGLSGFDLGSINSFWNLETCGVSSTAPRYGRTIEQMKQTVTYVGWNDDGPVWMLDEGNDYPRLAWEGTPGVPLPTHSLSEYVPEGSGTEWDPYRINTAEQLNAIGLFPDEWDKVFSLENDIDAGSLTQFRRIGTGVIPFSGTFEGNGFVISNFTYLTTENEWCIGLFGLTQDAVIQNLRLENVDISSNNTGVGSLAGAIVSGVLENCSSTGTVSGEDYVGGLICAGSGTMTNCYSDCTVSGNTIVGGFIGNATGTIGNCYSTGDVSGIGDNNEIIGGFAGRHYDGTIVSCYSTGDVHGNSKLGGFVGSQEQGFQDYPQTSAILTNCYTTGDVFGDEGSQYIGGFIGYQYMINGTASVSDCYSAGDISVGVSSNHVGGFMGYHYETVDNCYWDIETSGLSVGVGNKEPDPIGVIGKTTEQMQTQNTFAGWDFSAVNGDTADWHPPTTDYPHLAWEPYQFGGGSGTREDPYQIWKHQQIYAIGLNSDLWDKHFELMTDIDMSIYTGIQTNIIGYHSEMFPGMLAFTGSFDGNGHIIRNLTYTINDYIDCLVHIGLFGYIQDGVVKNLGLENISVSAGEFFIDSAGGLAGWNDGVITNCFVIGTINGDMRVGGLVGVNEGEIENCYSTSSVSGSNGIGGLAGNNNGMIGNSYMIGSVSGTDHIGGIVGSNDGSFTNCYAAASVDAWELADFVGGFAGRNSGTFSSCFWDTDLCETVGDGESGLIGKTTAEMQTLLTFTNAGWDFVGDGAGNRDIWRMCVDGVSYPRLSWEFSGDGDFACPDGVGLDDLTAIGDNWLASVETQPEAFHYACDANGDGAINLLDFSVLAANWLVD